MVVCYIPAPLMSEVTGRGGRYTVVSLEGFVCPTTSHFRVTKDKLKVETMNDGGITHRSMK